MPLMPRLVLLVASEPARLEPLGVALRRRGYHVLTARDGDRAADLLGRCRPDALLADVLLPGRSGFQLARQAKEQFDGQVPVVLMSPLGGVHRDYALALGVDRYLTPPPPPETAAAAIATLCPLPAVLLPRSRSVLPAAG